MNARNEKQNSMREKEYMKSLKQVKEIGEYKTQKKDESSSEEEYERNASDDDWDQVEVNTSSSNDTSDEDSVPAKPTSNHLWLRINCCRHLQRSHCWNSCNSHITRTYFIIFFDHQPIFSIAGVHIKKNSSSRYMYKRLKLYHTMALESPIKIINSNLLQ